MNKKKFVSIVTSVATVAMTTAGAFLPMTAGAAVTDAQRQQTLNWVNQVQAAGAGYSLYGEMWDALYGEVQEYQSASAVDPSYLTANIFGATANAQAVGTIAQLGQVSVPGFSVARYADGNYVFATSTLPHRTVLVDITNPSSPFVAKTITNPLAVNGFTDAVTKGSNAFVSWFGNGTWGDVTPPQHGGVEVYNYSTPSVPTSITKVHDFHFRAATFLQLLGPNYLSMTNGNSPGAFGIFDISNPTNVEEVPPTNDTACVNKGGPSAPFGCHPYRGGFNNAGWFHAGGNAQYVYQPVFGGVGNFTFSVADMSDRTNIVDLAVSVPLGPTVGFMIAPSSVVVGNYIYAGDFINDKIHVIDASNPSAPVVAGFVASGVDVQGLQYFQLSGSDYIISAGANGLFLYKLDLNNPLNPLTLVAQNISLGGLSGVVVFGTKAYVSSGAGQITVMDLAPHVVPPLSQCAIDALAAMGLNQGDFPNLDSELDDACEANPANVTVIEAGSEPKTNLKLNPGEIVVLGEGANISNNIIGDNGSENAVYMGNNVTVSGNVLKSNTIWVGGTGNLITGNLNHEVDVNIGPNAYLRINGNLTDLQNLNIGASGTLDVGGNVDIYVSADIASGALLLVGGNLDCNGSPTVNNNGTVTAGTNNCSLLAALDGGGGGFGNLATLLPLIGLAALGMAIYVRPRKQA